MFAILKDLTKAAVGVVIETPMAVVADVVTLGGALTEKHGPAECSPMYVKALCCGVIEA